MNPIKTRDLKKAKKLKQIVQLLEKEGKRIVTVSDITQIFKVSDDYADLILHRLEQKRWLNKIKKGIYQIIPSDYGYSLDVPVPQDSYYIASRLFKNYYISHFSAAFLHGLTDQIPSTVFVSTTEKYEYKPRPPHKFQFIYMSPQKLTFGCMKRNYRGVEIVISNIEKTLVDVIDKPKYAGGLSIVYEIVNRARRTVNLRLLFEYVLKMKKKSLVQRMGLLTELSGYQWTSQQIEQFQKYVGKNKSYLDPLANKKQIDGYSRKWQLIINVPLKYITGEKGVR